MRMTIDVSDVLMDTAVRESGLNDKRTVIEEGLRALIQRHRRHKLLAAFGKYLWDGDLPEQRGSW